MNTEYLYLIWKDPDSRRNFTVGKLSFDTEYTFQYLPEASDAKEYGWEYLTAFPEDKLYSSKILFPTFSSRLPDRKRRDIKNILSKYGMCEFEEFELLKKSGARLPIDTYEFIDPIFPEDKEIQREFYIMGVRHLTPCEGMNCDNLPETHVGEELLLIHDVKNEHDQYAIRVETQAGKQLGFVPRYFNKEILNRIRSNISYSCRVIEVNCSHSCSECIKVSLTIPKE